MGVVWGEISNEIFDLINKDEYKTLLDSEEKEKEIIFYDSRSSNEIVQY